MRRGFEMSMQNPLPQGAFWKDRRVLVTGHSGFVGGWASFWLNLLGAKVFGYSLSPATQPSLHDVLNLSGLVEETFADVQDLSSLRAFVAKSQPQVAVHLAAQPIVRQAYRDPVETFGTNVMGTVNLLQALRDCSNLQAIVVFTTDKVYRNVDWQWPYRENDALGGDEPYSASKSGAELVCEAFRNSYFARAEKPIPLIVVRAGNIIGGGDWSADRLLPDAVRAFAAKRPLVLRNPDAVRPWQHVLEPVRGMLTLVEAACGKAMDTAEGWNMGPAETQGVKVGILADVAANIWGEGAVWRKEGDASIPEANHLTLDSHRIAQSTGWRTIWPATAAVAQSISWYREQLGGADMRGVTTRQIHAYVDEVRGGNR
jgi:CDP-glucose 4,6-dehydratase